MATLKDVAKIAGVSVGTASRVINKGKGIERISDECIMRVEKAADELGYRVNYHAQSLQAGKSRAIGMVLLMPAQGRLEDAFLSSMIGGADIGARSVGYHFVSIGSAQGYSEIENGIRFLEEHRVDGLIVPGYYCSEENLEKLEHTSDPVVLMHFPGDTSIPVVNVDDQLGMIKAVEHLGSLGHKQILWTGPKQTFDGSEKRRLEGFREGVRENKIDPFEIVVSRTIKEGEPLDEYIEFIRGEIISLLPDMSGITGAVCYDEIVALGLYAALAEKGLRVPDDVSVIGFDDIYARTAYPPMTVVSHMHSEVGSQAVDLLIEMSSDKASKERLHGHKIDVEPELIPRKSTKQA